MTELLKKCPYCAMAIPDDAVVCAFCGATFRAEMVKNTFEARVKAGGTTMWLFGLSMGATAAMIGYMFGGQSAAVQWGGWTAVVSGAFGFWFGYSSTEWTKVEEADRQ